VFPHIWERDFKSRKKQRTNDISAEERRLKNLAAVYTLK